METFSASLAICAGNSPVTGEFPTQKSVTRSFDVFFDLRLNKRLSKQSWGWWLETSWCTLWRHCNELTGRYTRCKWLRDPKHRTENQWQSLSTPYLTLLIPLSMNRWTREHDSLTKETLIARFLGPTWGPSGADRTQVGPMLAPWTLLSGDVYGIHISGKTPDKHYKCTYLEYRNSICKFKSRRIFSASDLVEI